jgi:hypothetical protein
MCHTTMLGVGRPAGQLFVGVVCTGEGQGLEGSSCGKIRARPYVIWTACLEGVTDGPLEGPIGTNSHCKSRK